MSPSLQKKQRECRFIVAFGTGDLSQAADYASGTKFRSWKPFFYLLSKNSERAREALAELEKLPDLSDGEKNTVRAAKEMIGSSGRH